MRGAILRDPPISAERTVLVPENELPFWCLPGRYDLSRSPNPPNRGLPKARKTTYRSGIWKMLRTAVTRENT
jgi:hypothetical protein